MVTGLDHDLPGFEYDPWSPGDLETTAELVEKEGRKALLAPADVTDIDRLQEVVDIAAADLGGVDILVANSGVVSYAPVQEMSREQWDTCIAIMLTGVFNSLRVVAPRFVEQKSGRFIATASAVGRQGIGSNAADVAAKWGVIGLVKTAAIDLGRYRVTCNAVCPGMVNTPMLNNEMTVKLFYPDDPDATMDGVDELIDGQFHPILGGALEPEEISHAVVFLASEEARFISGSTIDVSAGWSASYTA